MSERRITLVIGARNAAQAAFAAVQRSMHALATGARTITGRIAGLFTGVGAKIVGGLAAVGVSLGIASVTRAVIRAYAQRQAAERQLKSALDATGASGEALLPMYREMASRIQDLTGRDDEHTKVIMAQLRAMGVRTDQMEGAAKAVYALTRAGMGEEQATRALVMAYNGEYTMLQRYIPTLRTARTEREKQAQLVQYLGVLWKQEKEDLNTLSGRWREFKNRVGDALEEVGQAVVDSGQLESGLAGASQQVKTLGNRFAEFLRTGGLQNAVDEVKRFVLKASSSLREFFESASALSRDTWDEMASGFMAGIDGMLNYIHKRQADFELGLTGLGLVNREEGKTRKERVQSVADRQARAAEEDKRAMTERIQARDEAAAKRAENRANRLAAIQMEDAQALDAFDKAAAERKEARAEHAFRTQLKRTEDEYKARYEAMLEEVTKEKALTAEQQKARDAAAKAYVRSWGDAVDQAMSKIALLDAREQDAWKNRMRRTPRIESAMQRRARGVGINREDTALLAEYYKRLRIHQQAAAELNAATRAKEALLDKGATDKNIANTEQRITAIEKEIAAIDKLAERKRADAAVPFGEWREQQRQAREQREDQAKAQAHIDRLLARERGLKDGGLGGRLSRRDRDLLRDWHEREAELRKRVREMQQLDRARERLENELAKRRKAVEDAQLQTAKNTDAIKRTVADSLNIAR